MTNYEATANHTGHDHDTTDAANRVCEHGQAVYLDHIGEIPFSYRPIMDYAISHGADIHTRTVSGAWSATIAQLGKVGNVFLWYRDRTYRVMVTTGSHRGLPVTTMLSVDGDRDQIMYSVSVYCRH